MKYILYYLIFFFLPVTTYSQIATGIVVDSSKNRLSGVTVVLKGTKQMTSTDGEGKFSIRTTTLNQTLQLSATGYKTLEVVADTKQLMLLTLQQKISTLDEVQVIAYGTTTQRYNVGSVTKVKAEDIGTQPVSNPLAALQGRVPGLVITATSGIPGAAFKVQIRGQNTLSSSVQGLGVALPIDNPLFIVDGIPFSPQNGNINQFSSIQSPTGAIFKQSVWRCKSF
ncbi:carboxypeptidase-like regulatory domain-containing protein [Pedobacter sp. NJ-S-72]